MSHPIMFDAADPTLARLRAVCLALPESSEKISHGRPVFLAGKVFAVYGSAAAKGMRELPHAVIVKADPGEHPALLADPRFVVPPYYGPSGWLALDLDRPDTEWDEVAELVATSYRQVALKRMIRALDAQEAARRSPTEP